MSGRQHRVGPPPTTGIKQLDDWARQVFDALRLLSSDSSMTVITSSYTVPFHSGVIYFNSGSAGTVFLPSGTTYRGALYTIKNLSTHTMGIDPVGANIEGSASTMTNTQDISYTVHFDGSSYRVL
jgi:hypothetical protein